MSINTCFDLWAWHHQFLPSLLLVIWLTVGLNGVVMEITGASCNQPNAGPALQLSFQQSISLSCQNIWLSIFSGFRQTLPFFTSLRHISEAFQRSGLYKTFFSVSFALESNCMVWHWKLFWIAMNLGRKHILDPSS